MMNSVLDLLPQFQAVQQGAAGGGEMTVPHQIFPDLATMQLLSGGGLGGGGGLAD